MGVFLQQKKVEKARKNGGLEAMRGFFIWSIDLLVFLEEIVQVYEI